MQIVPDLQKKNQHLNRLFWLNRLNRISKEVFLKESNDADIKSIKF